MEAKKVQIFKFKTIEVIKARRKVIVMKSIRNKIIIGIGGAVIISMVIVGYIMVASTSKTVSRLENEKLDKANEILVNNVDNYFWEYIQIARQMARDKDIKDFMEQANDRNTFQQLESFRRTYSMLGETMESDTEKMLAAYVISAYAPIGIDGVGWIPDADFDLKTRSYWFEDPEDIKRGYIITEPYQDLDTGNMITTISVPVYNNSGTQILGVSAIDITVNTLSKIVTEKSEMFPNSYRILMSKDNNIIAAKEDKYLLKNIKEVGYSDDIAKKLDDKSTIGKLLKFKDKGVKSTLIYGQSDITKWKVMNVVENKELYYEVTYATKLIIMLFIAAILITLICMLIIANRLSGPIRKLTEIADSLADGKMNTEIAIHSKDEIGILADTLRKLVNRLNIYQMYIDEISTNLEKFSDGDLRIELELNYEGEFAKIKNSLNNVSKKFKEIIGGLMVASNNLVIGAESIVEASNNIAESAEEESNTADELAANVNELSTKVSVNAENALEAAKHTKVVGTTANESNAQMTEMIQAITEINGKSTEIGKIIKVIEDIAFQTNILALNAAVEAARAGEAGKGFAVVADEVRNLASKSAEAAKDTNDLIGETVKAVENGTSIAGKTEEKLKEVIEAVNETVRTIETIANDSNTQSNALKETTTGINLIGDIVHKNTSIASETVIKSTELKEHVRELKSIADKFRL